MLRKLCWHSVVLFLLLVLAAPAWGYYGEWQDPAAVDMQETLAELEQAIHDFETMVERAIAGRSAAPGLLNDLETMVRRLKELQEQLEQVSAVWEAPTREEEPVWDGPVVRLDRRNPYLEVAFDFGDVPTLQPGFIHSFAAPTRLMVDSSQLRLLDPTRTSRGALVFPETHSGAYFHADFSHLNELTISMWIYLNDYGPESRGYARLFADEADSDLQLFLHSRGDRAYEENSLVITVGGYRGTTEANSVELNRWTHVAVVFDGHNVNAYINGQRQRLTDFRSDPTRGLDLPSDGTYFLANNAAGDRRLYGQFGDFQIWNRALTLTEVTDLYNTTR